MSKYLYKQKKELEKFIGSNAIGNDVVFDCQIREQQLHANVLITAPDFPELTRKINIVTPIDFPFGPPKIKITPDFPNVLGPYHMDNLLNEWCSAMTLAQILIDIRSRLHEYSIRCNSC